MIAAAMTTRNSGVPHYVDLAKAGAVIRRDIPASAFTRLHALVHDLEPVQAELSFGQDAHGHTWVKGYAHARMRVECQACSEPVAMDFAATLDGVLVPSEAEARVVAQALREASDANRDLSVIVVAGPELNEVDLVEDELLLQLPSQVCADMTCERRPAMTYGPEQGDSRGVGEVSNKPFAGLADMWRKDQ